ncbi:MAG TPA: hypothetical protein VF169_06585 [Albitalea sp.]|uniref:hypothetical protein n=1 Tax=Piscinibacter sp. TaxID=1903157 RepID=UPI002ED339DD
MSKLLAAALTMSACTLAWAQAMPTEFPADVTRPTGEALRTQISGKVYAATLASGTTWRLDYQASGFMFVNTSDGFADKARWRTEDGLLCSEGGARMPASCSEARIRGEIVYVKRVSTGEVIALTPK